MRSIGMNPSEEEVKAMIAEVDRDGGGSLDLYEFKKFMGKRRVKPKDSQEPKNREYIMSKKKALS